MLKGIKHMDREGVVHEVKEDPSGEDLASMNEIKRVLGQILPFEDVRQLVLFIFASGLSGRPIEKFFIFNGLGDTGEVLVNNSPGPQVHVPHFRIAHLTLRQPYIHAGA